VRREFQVVLSDPSPAPSDFDADLLRRYAETFQALIEDNPFGSYVVDAGLRLLHASKDARRAFASVTPLIGRDLAEALHIIWPEPFASEVLARFQHTLATGEPHVARGTVEHRADIDAVEAYDWRLERISLPDETYGVVCYFYDFSDRFLWEQRLQRSEARLALVQDAARIGWWDWNIVSGTLEWSEQCKALFQLPPDAVMSYRRFLSAIHPEDAAQVDAAVRRTVKGGAPFDVEMRVLLPDGEVRWIATKGRAYRDDSGRTARMSGMALDVTARKRAEEEALLADRRKSEFLSVLSHELRNPLAALHNSLQLLEQGGADEVRAGRAREMIRRQLEHLSRLVDDLLDLTRISRGKVVLQRQLVDLRELVTRTTDDFRSLLGDSGLALHVVLEGGSFCIDADATRVAQVLSNLLYNASKFTPRGGTVMVRLSSRDGEAELMIRDTGAGMEPGTIASMFEPFVQAEHTLARSKGGLGLGLPLVKCLTELHGGTVEARSAGPGRGSEFVVRFPLVDGRPEPERTLRVPSASPLSVLLVEDNVDAADSLAELLEIMGNQVRVARDGTSGLALARELLPDLVLCDIGLPDLDGYEVARAFRDDPVLRAVRLVALSGYTQPEEVERARDAGFDAHLGKPADVRQLVQLLEEDGEGRAPDR
jgi:PAS domain S-box-containing protein